MANFVNFLSKASEIIVWISKGARIVSAGKDIYDTVNSEDKSTKEKVARVGMNTLFIAAQTAEVVGHLGTTSVQEAENRLSNAEDVLKSLSDSNAAADKLSKAKEAVENATSILEKAKKVTDSVTNIRVGTRVASGITDLGKQITQEGVNVDTLATVAFRVADIGDSLIENRVCLERKENLEKVVQGCAAISTIAWNRKSIHSAGRAGYNCIKGITDGIRSRLNGYQHVNQETNQPEPMELDDMPIPNNNPNQNPAQISAADIQWINQEANKLRQLIQWEQLQEIPDGFERDIVLMNYMCAISNRPIRHVMTLNSEEAPIMYFERSAVSQWISDSPDQSPPEWPQQSLPPPIRNSYFKLCRHSQRIINNRLRVLSEDANRELQALRTEHPSLNL